MTIVGLGFIVDRLAAQGQASLIETWGGIASSCLVLPWQSWAATTYLRGEREL